MSDIIGSYPCGKCGCSVRSGTHCPCVDSARDEKMLSDILAKPEPPSIEEMIAEHRYATRDVSRAEFAAMTFKVDAMLTCLRVMHGGPHDIALGVTCKGCQAIRELEATLGLG